MPHFGIAHEDERTVLSPTNNILSQSLSDIKVGGGGGQFTGGGGISGSFGRSPSEIGRRGGRTGTRGAGLAGEVVSASREPVAPRGVINPRLALVPERATVVPEVSQELTTTETPGREGVLSVTRGELRPVGEVNIASAGGRGRGITTGITAAPVLGDIDFSSISGLVAGVGSVTEFARNLQKFNRARGITPGGKRRRKVKVSDIQKMIEFQQGRIDEGFVTEEELPEAINRLDILNQFVQGVSGTRSNKDAERTADEERIRKLSRGEL